MIFIFLKPISCIQGKYSADYYTSLGFPGGSVEENASVMQEMWVQSLGGEVSLEKKMATHSSILAREILWREEPGAL